VRHALIGPRLVVAAHQRARNPLDLEVDEHEGKQAVLSHLQCRPFLARDRGGDAIDPFAHQQAEGFLLPVGIVFRIADDQVILMSPQCRLEAPDELGEEWVGHVGHDHTNGPGPLCGKTPREMVGVVLEVGRRLRDPALHIIAHAPCAVEDMRHRCDGHACLTGDVSNISDGLLLSLNVC